MCVCIKNIKRALARSQQLCDRLKSSPLTHDLLEDSLKKPWLRSSIAEDPSTALGSPETPDYQTTIPNTNISRENEENTLHISGVAVSHEQPIGN